MIVDAHLHLFESADRFPRGTHPLYPVDLRAPMEDFLPVMDEHGVDCAVIVPLDHHDDYLAHVLTSRPDRFIGVGVLDDDDPNPVGSLRRRVAEVGIRGLRFGHLGTPGAADADGLERMPLLRAMAELGVVLWFYGPPEQLAALPTALHEVPTLRVVLNHLGFCPTGYDVDRLGRPRIETELPPLSLRTACALAEHPNVSVMFSGQYAFSEEEPPFRDLGSTVGAIGAAFGAHRLLWASDWPWIRAEPGYGRQMRFVDEFFPGFTTDERAAVMGGNASRLFSLEMR